MKNRNIFKKKLLYVLTSLIAPWGVHAQNVYNGSVTLTNQYSVDTFGANNYTAIVGNLILDGTTPDGQKIYDLSPLSTIDTILVNPGINKSGSLQIISVDSLKTFSGLNIKYIARDLYVDKNAVEDISALSALKYVGNWFQFTRNNSLRSFRGVENLDTIKAAIYIGVGPSGQVRGNAMLEDFCALTPVITSGGYLGGSAGYQVANNPYFNPALSDFMNGICSDSVYHGNAQLGTQAQVDAFSGTNYKKIINGKLQVFGSEIKDLSPLFHIDSVQGKLEIIGMDSLESLHGLNVRYVGSNVYLEGNKMLADIDGLSQLRYIGGDLTILDCDFLKDLNGASAVDSIKGSIYIGTEAWKNPPVAKGNDALTDLCGLTNVLVTTQGLVGSYNVANNGYNPSRADFNTGNCALPTFVNEPMPANSIRAYTGTSDFIIDAQQPVDEIILYNLNGQIVYKTSVQRSAGGKVVISHAGLVSGLYILTVKSGKAIERYKLVK